TLDYGNGDAVTGFMGQRMSPLAANSSNPSSFEAAPPGGQRLAWKAAGNPNCQSIKAATPTPTVANPYTYIKVTDIPVPSGSTHITLGALFVMSLSGGPSGALAEIGFLQVRPHNSSTWQVA